jgi:hypothetical protein
MLNGVRYSGLGIAKGKAFVSSVAIGPGIDGVIIPVVAGAGLEWIPVREEYADDGSIQQYIDCVAFGERGSESAEASDDERTVYFEV